jgi:hypothetical protein
VDDEVEDEVVKLQIYKSPPSPLYQEGKKIPP